MFGVEVPSEIVNKYEQKAIELNKEYWLKDRAEYNNKLYELQKEFVNEVLK